MKRAHLRQGTEQEWCVLETKEKMTVLSGESTSTEKVENDMIKDNPLKVKDEQEWWWISAHW